MTAETRKWFPPKRRAEYDILAAAIQRCHNLKAGNFHNYGGRGIRVCDEWRGIGGFARFLAHIGPRPHPNLTLDRYPDNDGDYRPGNVRWATRTEQNLSRRVAHRITWRGETLSISVWAGRYGLSRHLLRKRVVELGWSMEKAVAEPIDAVKQASGRMARRKA